MCTEVSKYRFTVMRFIFHMWCSLRIFNRNKERKKESKKEKKKVTKKETNKQNKK